jgi:hypothetical protein
MVYKIRAFSLTCGIACIVCFNLAGCGQGPVWLGTGLVIEDLLDPDIEVQDGLACWDLDGSGECDEEEDQNQDGICDALDCRGANGPAGNDGIDGVMGEPGMDGAAGPQGPPGTTVIIVQPPVDEPVHRPPFGRGPDGNGPPGHRP